jgi:hypothetical protein
MSLLPFLQNQNVFPYELLYIKHCNLNLCLLICDFLFF